MGKEVHELILPISFIFQKENQALQEAIAFKKNNAPSLPPFSFSSSIWLREHFMRFNFSGAGGFLWGTFISNKVSYAL